MEAELNGRVEGAGRVALVRRALWLERLTAIWMTVEAGIALGAGVVAHSITLIAFGADSLIELLSACVLLWRLRVELEQGQAFSEDAERRASRIGGVLLVALTLYVLGGAVWSLWRREGQEFSWPGLVLAVVAIPIMYWLARGKRTLADQLGSRALRADAAESVACGYLSAVVVVGLLAQALLGAWWVDGVSALVFVPFLVREAREAFEGDED